MKNNLENENQIKSSHNRDCLDQKNLNAVHVNGSTQNHNSTEKTEFITPRECLKPIRTLSFNHKVPVINLSRGSEIILFFTSAHLGVIYNVHTNYQNILRGHVNTIQSTCCSPNRRWLATADKGPDNAVIIWDAKTLLAVRTMLCPHPSGVICVELTPDARYLATLSSELVDQVFAIWDWTTGDEEPLCLTHLSPDFELQTKISFKQEDYFHVITNSETQVIFYDWNLDGKSNSYAPSLKFETFNQIVGRFSSSVYIPNTTTALTATSKGLVVVWKTSRRPTKVHLYDAKSESYYTALRPFTEESCYKIASKLVQLHYNPIFFIGITSCVSSKTAIVTGDSSGQIRFSDANFLLLYWYNECKYGGIVSISFADNGLFNSDSLFGKYGLMQFEKSKYSEETTIPRDKFVIEDFIVSTSQAVLLSMGVEGKIIKIIEREQCMTVNAIATHPRLDLVVSCGYSGMIKIWNYKSMLPIQTRVFAKEIQCCAFDPTGEILAIGFTNGVVMFLDAITLNDFLKSPFDYARDMTTKIAFSSDSKFCAYIDKDRVTTLVRRSFPGNQATDLWVYVGRYRAHSLRIVDVVFIRPKTQDYERLLTLGEDRMIVEYDIHNATYGDLPIRKFTKIEQTAVPHCFMPMQHYYQESFICIANSDSRFRLFNAINMACRKTVLAPIEGISYKKLLALPDSTTEMNPPSACADCLVPCEQYSILFITRERLGLILLPLDGDPYKNTNVIAHPTPPRGSGIASDMAVCRDGHFVFTVGGPDYSIHMWKVDQSVLVEQSRLFGNEMTPFYNMLTPELLNDMKDFFYLAMLRQQGISSMETRLTSLTIPITEIPFVMRALGFCPSDEQIEIMIDEIKFSHFHETGHYTDEINLDTFIKLYINHRDIDGAMFEQVSDAFKAIKIAKEPCQSDCRLGKLCEDESDETLILRDHLLILLQTLGEPMRHDELVDHLAVLLGIAQEAGNVEDLHAFDDLAITSEIEQKLPLCLTPKSFIDSILGYEYCADIPEVEDITRKYGIVNKSIAAICQTD